MGEPTPEDNDDLIDSSKSDWDFLVGMHFRLGEVVSVDGCMATLHQEDGGRSETKISDLFKDSFAEAEEVPEPQAKLHQDSLF
jgi:hypothetical protein